MRILVDLPAPLAPINPTISPDETAKDTPLRASKSPKRLRSSCTLIKSCAWGEGAVAGLLLPAWVLVGCAGTELAGCAGTESLAPVWPSSVLKPCQSEPLWAQSCQAIQARSSGALRCQGSPKLATVCSSSWGAQAISCLAVPVAITRESKVKIIWLESSASSI